MSDLYSVKELCEALEVPVAHFLNHIFRRANPQKYQDEKMQLMLSIKQIFNDCKQRYGAGKICAVLAETGQQVSTKRVSSVMQELSLQSVHTDVKSSMVSCSSAKSEICCRGILLLIVPIRYGSVISSISKSTILEYIFAPSSTSFPAGSWNIVYHIPPAPVLSRPPSGKLTQSAAIPQNWPSTATEAANTHLIHFRNFSNIATSSNFFGERLPI